MRVSSISAVLLGLGVALASSQSLAQSPPAPPILLVEPTATGPQCSDGIDNDGDGKIDFPTSGIPDSTGDDGCWDPSDNDERAGLPAGTVTSASGECSSRTLTIAGNTYNNCDFGAGEIFVNAANITIENSIIRGPINGTQRTTLTVRDSNIIGTSDYRRALTGEGNYLRVRTSGFPQTWYARGRITVRDSISRDVCSNRTDIGGGEHTEIALMDGPDPVVLERNWFYGSDSPEGGCDYGQSQGGGISAVIAIYSHSGFWADVANKTLASNRIQTDATGITSNPHYHLYAGYGCGTTPPTGMVFTNNVFAGSTKGGGTPAVVGWSSSGNTWTGNVRGENPKTTLATGTAFTGGGCY